MMQQATNVGLTTGMMNDGRHHHHPFKTCNNCCCFGGYQYQDHQGCHANNNAANLAYYQTYNNHHHQVQNTWYANSSATGQDAYQPNQFDSSSWSSSAAGGREASSNSWKQPPPQTSPLWSSSSSNNDQFYSSYPTPPTPAGSTGSTEYPASIPSDHYPPTPYSVDLSSPNNNATSQGFVHHSSSSGIEEDIPLHELIGAAEAVEADLLESMGKADDKPKNNLACVTSSSINSSGPSSSSSSSWREDGYLSGESYNENEQQHVAETAAAPLHRLACNGGTSGTESPQLHQSVELPVKESRKRPYDEEQLQRYLSDACSEFLASPAKRQCPLGYPLEKLVPAKRICLRFSHSSPSRSRSPSPPVLLPCALKSPAERKCGLAKKRDAVVIQKKEERKTEEEFTFACSGGCGQTWPLENVSEISRHLCRTWGTSPSSRAVRTSFSSLFAFFAYKVHLIVNPKNRMVSTKSVISCTNCPKDFELSRENEDLAQDLLDHLVGAHPDSRLGSNEWPSDFCHFCDRRVHDLHRHMDEYFSIHHSRLLALATAFCNEDYEEDLEAIESECKKCGKLYVPDQRLPDWMSRASCSSCLFWSLDASRSKSKVILCQYCRQGKFGHTRSCQSMSISICVNCSKMARAFQAMTESGQKYVTGMLNELLKQLDESSAAPSEPEIEPTFSLRQFIQSSIMGKVPGKLVKFQAFTLGNLKTVEAVSALHSTSQDNGQTFYCSQCAQKWPVEARNWPDIVGHIVQHCGAFGKHLTKNLDQHLVALQTECNATSLASVLRCRKCKFYLTSSSVAKHAERCWSKQSADVSCCSYCGLLVTGANADHACLSTLKNSLLLGCSRSKTDKRNCLVCKKTAVKTSSYLPLCASHISSYEKFSKLPHCFAAILDAFCGENSGVDSIEELIVAAKQKIKSQSPPFRS